MASLNKIQLIGNLGRDPEIRYTQSGAAVANFSVATADWVKSGEQKKSTWHNIIAWEKLGEFCAEFLKKGDQVYVEGRVQIREYEDKNGVKKMAYEVVAQSVQKLGKRDDAPKTQTDDVPF